MGKFNPRKIRERREELKMTQTALAKESGVARVYLVNVEHGKSIPTATVLGKIANALKVNEGYFFDEVEPAQENPSTIEVKITSPLKRRQK